MIICQPSVDNKWNSETSIKLLLHLILVTGIVAWSNKAQYRVMMVDIFKKYKPSSWDVVKGDYGYTDEVPDYGELSPLFNTDEFLNNNAFSTNDVNTENKGHIFKAISTGICTTAKEISDEFYNETANHTKTLDIDTRKCISDAKEELLIKFVDGKQMTPLRQFLDVLCAMKAGQIVLQFVCIVVDILVAIHV